ncbi:MAG: methionyl-tRNA formyltransferase [Proteobacteria bacterium]|nr:methionyl-tRNA formyltransferase [Pseudomonadota bacterium]
MRIAFMGTPVFAEQALEELVAAGHHVAAVYTQPPRARGRGQALRPSAVGAAAERLGLPVRTPASMRDPAEIDAFRGLELDAAAVVAFGQILPREVLEAPRLGCFNLHASLLPRWRGAAPIQRAIMAGDTATGVQVMRMTEGLDEGAVLLSETVPITFDETSGTLHDKLALAGAPLLARALDLLARGEAVETPQAEEGATYSRKIKPEEARIDWSRPGPTIDRQVRGLSPFPGTWFEAPSDRAPVRIKALRSIVSPAAGVPGEVLDPGAEGGVLIACGEGAVRLTELQREGRGAQDATAFLRGFPLPVGTVLA